MNVLYKYCDKVGLEGILETLELKLPYVSHVNDPLECLPVIYCPDDKKALYRNISLSLKRKGVLPPKDFNEKFDTQFKQGELQKKLITAYREELEEYNEKKGCLLSVSKNPKETVMYAHYSDRHEGGVIGIDFDIISSKHNSPPAILMRPVEYSENRPKINVLEDSQDLETSMEIALHTKSLSWDYEKECRTIFFVDKLKIMMQKGLANYRKLTFDSDRKSWFLKLNPASIKEVIFGLYAEVYVFIRNETKNFVFKRRFWFLLKLFSICPVQLR